jgi:hypothetical protein
VRIEKTWLRADTGKGTELQMQDLSERACGRDVSQRERERKSARARESAQEGASERAKEREREGARANKRTRALEAIDERPQALEAHPHIQQLPMS